MYLIIDFEATCDDPKPNDIVGEIIEFGVVLADENWDYVDEFQSFVKPVQDPILTEFCTELTTITQQDVDSAPLFPEVMKKLEAELEEQIEAVDILPEELPGSNVKR